MLDERGVAWVAIAESATEYTHEGILYRAYEICGGLQVAIVTPVTPEQAIAATVGNRTDLAKRLREVNGLHEFAELFGFSWEDDSDWDWHDVACAMADAVDAATVVAVPETKYLMALDDAREARTDASRWERIARDHRSVCKSLKETNADLRRIIEETRAATAGAGTCDGSFHESSDLSSGRVPLYYCKDTNRSIFVEREAKVCPLCGGRIKEEAE